MKAKNTNSFEKEREKLHRSVMTSVSHDLKTPLYDSASHEISHASSAVTNEIRSNPVRSSAIALGAGVLLGMIFRPSRNRK